MMKISLTGKGLSKETEKVLIPALYCDGYAHKKGVADRVDYILLSKKIDKELCLKGISIALGERYRDSFKLEELGEATALTYTGSNPAKGTYDKEQGALILEFHIGGEEEEKEINITDERLIDAILALVELHENAEMAKEEIPTQKDLEANKEAFIEGMAALMAAAVMREKSQKSDLEFPFKVGVKDGDTGEMKLLDPKETKDFFDFLNRK